MQQRERERKKREKKREKKTKQRPKKWKNQNTTTKKEQRKSNFFWRARSATHFLYILLFTESLKGERKERRGRFDLHNNAQKHTEDTLRAKKKAFVDKTTTRFFTETRVSLRRRTKGRGDSWRARFWKIREAICWRKTVEEETFGSQILSLLSLFIYSSVVKKYEQ